VGIGLVGVALLALEVVLSKSMANQLAEQGRPTRPAWIHFWSAPFTWGGVVFVVAAVNPTAAAALGLTICLVVLAFSLVLIVRGVRGLPEFIRGVRRIGDPDAWRGKL